MSGYGNGSGRSGDRSPGHHQGNRRSVSPRDGRRDGPYGRRDSRSVYNSYDSHGEERYGRGGAGGDRGRGRYNTGRGGGYSGGRGGRGNYEQTPRSTLPDLPSEVEIPGNGRRFQVEVAPMVGTIGEPTKIIVNHYEIQSLPVVRTYTYDVSCSHICNL